MPHSPIDSTVDGSIAEARREGSPNAHLPNDSQPHPILTIAGALQS
jgi:hypothetical protein